MGDKALETEGGEEAELEQEKSTGTIEDKEGESEFEFVAEGEEKPSSAPVPFAAFKHKVDKLNGKVRAETEGRTKAEDEAEMYKAQVELYQLKEKQGAGPPKLDDFDTEEEYEAAKAKHDDERVKQLATEQVKQILGETQQTATQEQAGTKLEKQLYAHYERAEELKVSDYDETEAIATNLFGNDIAKQIMAKAKNSHELMYHFGKPANAAKAMYFKNLISSDPVSGLLELGGYKLKKVSKRSLASDPETVVEGGSGIKTSAWDKKLDAMRAKVSAGTAKMNDLIALKKEKSQAEA